MIKEQIWISMEEVGARAYSEKIPLPLVCSGSGESLELLVLI